ncbi:arylesterase [Mesorhizobium xinjiangense]|uniref:arylesterase n=1 Tax=Mesorhizobium xinjiangense TaxID=2678685 RepID=UPI0012EDA256|nr:arylesterase [Mesorhizobium xinjiangense]
MAIKRLFSVFLFLAGISLAVPAAAATINIVGFGDSLMAGYQLAPGQSFPAKLEKALRERGHDVTIANAGVSGDTTSAGLARLDWSVPEGTGLVILELGANDMLRGLSPDRTRENLDRMIGALKTRGIVVMLIGMRAAPNLGEEYAAAFDAIYPSLAQKHGLVLYPFFLDGVAAHSELLLADGMHPNARGVERMVEKALPFVEEALSTAR